MKRLRRLNMGLATLLGRRPLGFFIPYRYADSLPPPGQRGEYAAVAERFAAAEAEFDLWLDRIEGYADSLPPPGQRGEYAAVAERFAAAEAEFDLWLDRIEGYADALAAIGDEPPPAPRWNQDWFPGLDAAMAYTMLRHSRPARIIEVGSGHSTRFMARAIADARAAEAPYWNPTFTAVDPAPRASIESLDLALLRETVDRVPPDLFRMLGPGDLLFLDSSHILMPGSDVDLLLNRILPMLPPGVLVHVHDIFLPEDYPPEWDWRGYNEQLALVPLLAFGTFRPLFASRHVRRTRAARLKAGRLPALATPQGLESSLWMVRTG